MTDTITDGPAFPYEYFDPQLQRPRTMSGMTLRQYAAVHLKVPNSGTDWLNEMIEEAIRKKGNT